MLNKKYQPKFSKAIQHFLLHTGGRGVIEELEESLKLTPEQAQPAKDTLYRFGNTSAASTWYILAGIESKLGICKGDRIWQLGRSLPLYAHHISKVPFLSFLVYIPSEEPLSTVICHQGADLVCQIK